MKDILVLCLIILVLASPVFAEEAKLGTTGGVPIYAEDLPLKEHVFLYKKSKDLYDLKKKNAELAELLRIKEALQAQILRKETVYFGCSAKSIIPYIPPATMTRTAAMHMPFGPNIAPAAPINLASPAPIPPRKYGTMNNPIPKANPPALNNKPFSPLDKV